MRQKLVRKEEEVTKHCEAIFTTPGRVFISERRKRAGAQRARGAWLRDFREELPEAAGAAETHAQEVRGSLPLDIC
ncbi:hypothetical protein AV530_001936 [Patagioenas fasciata monilis]|uniref:Uncharacterized protein n=1 Tax=Patagioenas fasciata monilis TaxID=372326 RepID=A0A1V4J6M7_PATFA|nr:hypothetical protein AV530_001936 [Patagioenas fasciata monilis]